MFKIFQAPLRSRSQHFIVLLEVQFRDCIAPGVVQNLSNFLPEVDVNI